MRYKIGLNAERKDIKIDQRLEGVGMIRSEYPCRLIEEYFTLSSCQKYMYNYLDFVCNTYKPFDVWYRNADFIVQEINVLKGVDRYLDESNYMMGLRGVRRGLKYQDTFNTELKIVSTLSQKQKNLNLLFSFIKDPTELEQILKLLNVLGFKNKLGIMVEIPSAIIMLDEFIKLGVSNITIGVNDLTSFVLGADRNSKYHDCNHPAILRLIQYCCDIAHTHGIEVSVGGILNKELIENCDKIGVNWMVVNYSQLPELLDIPAEKFGDYAQLGTIKKLTKSKRNELELQKHIEFVKGHQ